ncbi:acetamidase/formamidase family protein [Sphingomonas sp. NIBR02145]|uniref:acetamidase/formamidase family protein n=1 Tax=Sphingomonas sp. NIBR02145 TaxID=3014784 RepID=UPI0022B3A073|nr:acetamidase/formamidase family protein [Sphingomonas sp. NIBR02145]WHU00852.1 acetamidase/formamidase family protein [Sphingomonas sp. NIBR02145]
MRGGLWSAAALVCAMPAAAQAQERVAGRWIVTVDYFGTPTVWTLNLRQDGATITGDLTGDVLTGTVKGNEIRFLARDSVGGSEDVTARLVKGRITGEMLLVDGSEPKRIPHRLRFTAERPSEPAARPPMRHEFVPTRFYREFSPSNPPALHVNPGDTIHTSTIDAAGIDADGVRRAAPGNPQTGPFYIDGAMPGDTLVVRIRKLRLNRDTAISTNGMTERGQDARTAVRLAGTGKPVTWRLDRDKGIATPEAPGDALKGYWVPVRPMLGGIGVAVDARSPAPGSGDVGRFGGNMDFNEMGEGTTVYLPVAVPGALLYFGDAHAAQGDGETTGDALETSMDVEVEVDLVRGKSAGQVRIETSTHLVAIGMDGSLDASFRTASSSMFAWLSAEYGLSPADIAQIYGTAAEYRVSAVPGRAAGMVLKIPKARLATLPGARKP